MKIMAKRKLSLAQNFFFYLYLRHIRKKIVYQFYNLNI